MSRIASVLLALLLAGCASAPPLEQPVSDEQLGFLVEQAIRKEPALFGTSIVVSVINGAVELSGYVQTDRQRDKAGEAARGVEGVRTVINNIHL